MTGVASHVGWAIARRHARAYAAIALLLGLTAGLSLIAVAGARRTQSAYTRFLRSANASTMSVTTFGLYEAASNAEVAALPEVAQSRTYVGFNVYPLSGGRPELSKNFEASGTFDGRYIDMDRFTATRGRAANPKRVDEVEVNELAAEQLGLRVGQRLELGTYSNEQVFDPTFLEHPPAPLTVTHAKVVGVGVLPDEVLQDDGDRTARLLLTPAFSRAARPYTTYGLQGLVLRRGDRDVDRVRTRLAARVPPGTIEFRFTAVDVFHAEQAVRPLAVALGLFGAVAGIAGLVMVLQALAQVLRVERDERAVLRAFGAPTGTIGRAALLAPALAIVSGTVLAVVFAIGASPAMPVGPMRRVEVARGFDVDATVLALGAVLVVTVLLAGATVLVWRELPHRVARRHRPVRPARAVTMASSAGMAPSAVAGLGFAFGRPDDTSSASTRSVMLGAAVAVAALVGAITFGASLRTLVHEPPLYGWNWDAALLASNGYGDVDSQRADAILRRDRRVAAWSGGYFGLARIGGRPVPLLGMAPGSTVFPPMLRGRPLQGAGETVLGPATADQLHVDVGDSVSWAGGGTPRRLRVVGIATFPTIGAIHAVHTSLGTGAEVVPELVPGSDRDLTGEQVSGLGPNVVFVRYRAGTNAKAELAHLHRITRPLAGFAGLDVLPVQRPAEIVNASSIGNVPVLLAGALALGAVVSLTLALGSSVRRRRQDLAVLKTLGFTRRQLGATVSWHATAAAVVGLLVGAPVGVAAGRSLWELFAGQLDVVASPTVPLLTLFGVAAAALVVANAVSTVPGRAARRVDTSSLLRPE